MRFPSNVYGPGPTKGSRVLLATPNQDYTPKQAMAIAQQAINVDEIDEDGLQITEREQSEIMRLARELDAAEATAAEGEVVIVDPVDGEAVVVDAGTEVIPTLPGEDAQVVDAGAEVVASPDGDAAVGEVDDATGLKHVGGGWYELPNGERVQGKEQAEAAHAASGPSEVVEPGPSTL